VHLGAQKRDRQARRPQIFSFPASNGNKHPM
jgi:hypothetical protein